MSTTTETNLTDIVKKHAGVFAEDHALPVWERATVDGWHPLAGHVERDAGHDLSDIDGSLLFSFIVPPGTQYNDNEMNAAIDSAARQIVRDYYESNFQNVTEVEIRNAVAANGFDSNWTAAGIEVAFALDIEATLRRERIQG